MSWLEGDAEWRKSDFPDKVLMTSPIEDSVSDVTAEQEAGRTNSPTIRGSTNTSTEFDPYYVLLGISTDEPIDHYGLLGLKRFESNGEFIEMAADRQMGNLQRYESGEHCEQIAKLMSEVSRARICLLDPAKKSAYDEQLRS